MIMRINPYVGISRMRRFRMVDMSKGKRKLWLRGTDDVLVVGLHMVGKGVKVLYLNNVTSFLALYFFLSLDSSLSYLPCHSSFLFLFFFFHSFILIFFLFLYFSYYYNIFSFFSILILFSLFFPLLTSFQSSQLLSFLHAYNLKF
jgi:hypothetical protein